MAELNGNQGLNSEEKTILSNKAIIIQLIAQGKLELAIKETLALAKEKKLQAHRNVTILSCRYYILWENILIGTASTEEKETIINKIAASLYDIVAKIPDTS